ncbi:MAG TPA: type II toxin-antitoxin system VapC family toxin [Verrucomicrobiota bacterium]|nr:type II toxin-antitoxin system VapC family toxin [Verrucomicrobiota bacterium]
METVYIETTIVSLLVARSSRDPITAAHQQITRLWWQDHRLRLNCVTSEEVVREASHGDAEMIRLRLEALAGLPVLPVTETARELAKEIIRKGLLPPQAVSDAIHAAVAATEGIETLLTWNCRHLANPTILRSLRVFMSAHGLTLPEVCTPVELGAD